MNNPQTTLARVALFPGLRVLTWAENQLYASRGYTVLGARIENPGNIEWRPIAHFRPSLRRRVSARNRLTARLFRDGFHAHVVLPSGAIVGAVPGSIVTLRPGETEFQQTHAIVRGTRPLHISAVPDGTLYWGEYFDNAARDEVHIYASSDEGLTWHVAHSFAKGAIRHVHNIVHDRWQNCLWILTGDYGEECRILRASYDLGHIETVIQGNQQARAVAAVPTQDALYFSSDTPLESNYIYSLDRQEKITQLAAISSSSICGCRVGSTVFFSTMVEPSEANPDRKVRLYASDISNADSWAQLLSWQKDFLPMGLFQYGNGFLPNGDNITQFLAVSTIAVEGDDLCTSLYALDGQ